MPASIDAEKAILAAVLISPEAYDSASAAGLRSGDMHLDSHRRIYCVLEDMREAGQAVDIITVAEELKQRKQLDAVGGYSYLASLAEGMPARPSIRAYVKSVREKAKLRRLLHTFNSGVGAIGDGSSSAQCIDSVSELMLQIQADSEDSPAERVIKFSDAVYADWERIADSEAELIGLTTGIEAVDLVTTGVRSGEFWMVAGRTGDGKSAMTLQMAAANCRSDIPVGIFSLEMSKADILQRLWSTQGGIPFGCIRNPRRIGSEMRSRVKQAMAQIATWPLFIVEDGSLSIQKLLATARLMIRQEKVRLIIVDYVQSVGANAANERERLTKVSNQLRALAKDTGVPIVAISQLNRPKDRNPNERPNKFSLKESGSLENDAHVILMVYRPVDEADRPTGEDLIIVAKQRHGPVSNEPVYFDSRTLTFRERTSLRQ
jgi:replicative DNA helicase